MPRYSVVLMFALRAMTVMRSSSPLRNALVSATGQVVVDQAVLDVERGVLVPADHSTRALCSLSTAGARHGGPRDERIPLDQAEVLDAGRLGHCRELGHQREARGVETASARTLPDSQCCLPEP